MCEADKILQARGLPYYCKNATEGSGDCFFHALVDQIKEDDAIANTLSQRSGHIDYANHLAVRKAVVDFCRHSNELLDSEWAIWRNDYINEQREQSHFHGLHQEVIWRICLERMEQPGTWVNQVFVAASAMYFAKDIIIVGPRTNFTLPGSMGNQQANGPPFVMVHAFDHFQSVHRALETCSAGPSIGEGSWWSSFCNIL